jgi:YfiH family protein
VSSFPAASEVRVLTPQWPAPAGVQAAFTLRAGGVSRAPFDSLNIAAHVGDAAQAVGENRRRLCEQLRLPGQPAWVEQVHGTAVADLDASGAAAAAGVPADVALTRRPGTVCAVQVADCLPVLFAARDGCAVAAAHAGWRGLAAGVLEAAVAALAVAPGELMAWLGPCIGPAHFEVGEEVRSALLAKDGGAAGAFAASPRGRWLCDLAALARRRLERLGVAAVFGAAACTYTDRARFFSYRRDGQCGRMAALIWLES